MSNRFATRIGLPSADERPPDAYDVVAFHEPAVGAQARTKGSLFLLAQLTGGNQALAAAAREALAAIERDYYYDLSAGVLVALAKALSGANRRLYHQRRRLGIPRRAGVSIVAVVVRGREAHVAKLGPASAVVVRDGRMYEVPPPPTAVEEDPRVRRRRVAATLGEALEVEPYTWHGAHGGRRPDRARQPPLRPHRRRGRAAAARSPRCGRRPAIEHLQQVFAIRGGSRLRRHARHRDRRARRDRDGPPARAGPTGRAVRRTPRPEPRATGRRDRPRLTVRPVDAAEGARSAIGTRRS